MASSNYRAALSKYSVPTIRATTTQRKLGEGASAVVEHCTADLSDGRQAAGALKKLKLDKPQHYTVDKDDLANEACYALALQDPETHPSGRGCRHLPSLLAVGESVAPPDSGDGTDVEQGKLPTQLLMQYAGNRTLRAKLNYRRTAILRGEPRPASRPNGAPLSQLEMWCELKRLVRAALHMEQGGLVHCDLAPQNVVCASQNTVLVDLASALPIGQEMDFVMGSAGHIAPEIHQAVKEGRSWTASSKIFVYALGQLVCVMALRVGARKRHALTERNLNEFLLHHGYVAAYARQELTCCAKMTRLMRWMTSAKPRDRPSLSRLLRIVTQCLRWAERQHARTVADSGAQSVPLPAAAASAAPTVETTANAAPPPGPYDSESQPRSGTAPVTPAGRPCVLAAVFRARPPADAPPAAPTAEVAPQQLSVAGPAAGHGEDILPKGLPQLATQPPAPAPPPEASSGQWADVRDAAVPPEGSPSQLSQRTPYAALCGSPQSLLQATPHWAHGSMPSTPGTAFGQQPAAAHPGPFAEGKPSAQTPVHAGRGACAGAPCTGPPPGLHGAHAKWVPPADWHRVPPFIPGARRMPAAPMMHAMQPAMWVLPGLHIVPVPPHQQMPWPVPGFAYKGQCWQGRPGAEQRRH